MRDDKTISRIREARKKISARFSHSPEKLVQHYIKIQMRHKDRLIGSAVITK